MPNDFYINVGTYTSVYKKNKLFREQVGNIFIYNK